MAIWDDVLSDRDRKIFEAAGWGQRAGYGQRPAIMVIDMNYNFCGDTPRTDLRIDQALAFLLRRARLGRHRSNTKDFKSGTREAATGDLHDQSAPGGRFRSRRLGLKGSRSDEEVDVMGHKGNEIVAEVAPLPEDIFIEKRKPSAFFGTPLMSYLTNMRADSLILTGTTTSGCVRASAVDALSYDLRVTIPEEAVFDRGELSHKVALFDLHMKYVDVTTLSDVLGYLEKLPAGLFDETYPPAAAAATPRNKARSA